MKLKRPYPHYKFPHEIVIECIQLDTSSCKWHSVKEGSFQLRCTNYGHFPTEILMGTIKGKFADTYNIGAQIGGNFGSASLAVIDLNKSIQMLKGAGYKVKGAN